MGYELYREVKVYAPASLTHREKLTAMVLADDANDQTRLTWSSVVDPEIMRQALVKNGRDMLKIVARLQEEKVIEHGGGGHNGRVAKFRFLHLAPAVGGPDSEGESHPATPQPKGVQNERPTPAVARSNRTPYVQAETSKGGENEHPSGDVGCPISPRRVFKTNTPTPSPPTTTSSSAPAAEPATAKPPVAKQPSKHQVADDLTAAFWKHHGKGRAQPFLAVRGVIRTAIGNGVDRDQLAKALDQVAREGRAISGATLDIALGSLNQPGARQQRGGARALIPSHDDFKNGTVTYRV